MTRTTHPEALTVGMFADALNRAAERIAENDARPCAIRNGRPCDAIADPTHTRAECMAVQHRASWHRGADRAGACEVCDRYPLAPAAAAREARASIARTAERDAIGALASYAPRFVVEAETTCPACGHVGTHYASPDERPTPARCPSCAVRLWATLDAESGRIWLVDAGADWRDRPTVSPFVRLAHAGQLRAKEYGR